MRIGFNFHSRDNYISGVEYYSLGLLRALLEIDYKNQYVVFTNKPDMVKCHIGHYNNLNIRYYSFLKSRLSRIFWEHSRLPFLATQERLDVLHCPHYICPVIKSSAAYVITIHDTIAIDHPEWCKKTNSVYYKMFMRQALKSASRIIAVSQFTSERIYHNFNVNNSKIKIIPPGIDNDIFNLRQDAERQRKLRSRYKINEKYILFSGNIEPKKNIFNLLRAFKLLKNAGLKHSLVISGQRTWKSKKVFDFIRTKFSSTDVILAGYIDRKDIGTVYRMADCLALPSLCEGFGFPALEAFACGVPVAASCVGILKQITEKAYSRLEPHNPEQIANSIHRLLTNQKLRDEQTAKAINEAEKFKWSYCAAKTLELYKEIIKQNG